MTGENSPLSGIDLEKTPVTLDPVVTAVGGVDAARDALWETCLGTHPGKIAVCAGCKHP